MDDGFVGEGYGIATPASREAIEVTARTEAIFLDPTYTAKAMAGLIARVRRGDFRPNRKAGVGQPLGLQDVLVDVLANRLAGDGLDHDVHVRDERAHVLRVRVVDGDRGEQDGPFRLPAWP